MTTLTKRLVYHRSMIHRYKHHTRSKFNEAITQVMLTKTTAEAKELVVQAYMKDYKVSRGVAVALSNGIGRCSHMDAAYTIEAHNKLKGKYYYRDTDIEAILRENPGIFNEQLMNIQEHFLHTGKKTVVFTEAASAYVGVSEHFQRIGRIIDKRYWKLSESYAANLAAAGLNDRVILDFYIKMMQHFEMDSDKQLPNLLNAKYLRNIFKEGLPFVLKDTLKAWNPAPRNALVKALMEAIVDSTEINNRDDWLDVTAGHAIRLLLWTARYTQWYAGHTIVHSDILGGPISINHHELIRFVLINPNHLPMEFNFTDHPSKVLEDALGALAINVSTKLVNGGKDKFYPMLDKRFADLPPRWEYISTEYRQISEGQAMNHCCGGEHYRARRQTNDSIFFHLETNEPHGLTVELGKYVSSTPSFDHPFANIHQEAQTYIEPKLNAAIMKRGDAVRFLTPVSNVDANDFFIFNSGLDNSVNRVDEFYRIRQVKGRYNRNPTKEEWALLRRDLLRITSLHSLSRYVHQDMYVVTYPDRTRYIIHLFEDKFTSSLVEAAERGGVVLPYDFNVGLDQFVNDYWDLQELDIAIVSEGGRRGHYTSSIEPVVRNSARNALTGLAGALIEQRGIENEYLNANIAEQRHADYINAGVNMFRNAATAQHELRQLHTQEALESLHEVHDIMTNIRRELEVDAECYATMGERIAETPHPMVQQAQLLAQGQCPEPLNAMGVLERMNRERRERTAGLTQAQSRLRDGLELSGLAATLRMSSGHAGKTNLGNSTIMELGRIAKNRNEPKLVNENVFSKLLARPFDYKLEVFKGIDPETFFHTDSEMTFDSVSFNGLGGDFDGDVI